MPGIRKWARRSDLLWLLAFEMLRYLSFTTSCGLTGTSYSSLRRELLRVIKSGEVDWERLYSEEEQLIIGIDEQSFRGQRMSTTITDIANHRLLAVLKDHRMATISQFLREVPPKIKEKVIEVCGDMKWMYVKLVEGELPEAEMVVDKFHLIQDANSRIDEARRIEQEAVKKEIKRKIFLRTRKICERERRNSWKNILRNIPP